MSNSSFQSGGSGNWSDDSAQRINWARRSAFGSSFEGSKTGGTSNNCFGQNSFFGTTVSERPGTNWGFSSVPLSGSTFSSFGGNQSMTPTYGTTGFSFWNQQKGGRREAFSATGCLDEEHLKMQSLSAMPIYKNKSHEELRLEDYNAGNRGSGGPGICWCASVQSVNSGSNLSAFGSPFDEGSKTGGTSNNCFGPNSFFGTTVSERPGTFWGFSSVPFSGSTSSSFGGNQGTTPTYGNTGFSFCNQHKESRSEAFSATGGRDEEDFKLQSLSAMPIYFDKSFEELRLEDYNAGNRGQMHRCPLFSTSQTSSTQATSTFVPPQTASNLFSPQTSFAFPPHASSGVFSHKPFPSTPSTNSFPPKPVVSTFAPKPSINAPSTDPFPPKLSINVPTTDPFAFKPSISAPSTDPFAPKPFISSPSADDPFAPKPSIGKPSTDPFAPKPSINAPSADDPFAPKPSIATPAFDLHHPQTSFNSFPNQTSPSFISIQIPATTFAPITISFTVTPLSGAMAPKTSPTLFSSPPLFTPHPTTNGAPSSVPLPVLNDFKTCTHCQTLSTLAFDTSSQGPAPRNTVVNANPPGKLPAITISANQSESTTPVQHGISGTPMHLHGTEYVSSSGKSTNTELNNDVNVEAKVSQKGMEETAIRKDEDTGPQIAPNIKLDQNEDTILDLKGKQYFFDTEGNQWKKRGSGSVKLLKHKTTGNVVFVMRQSSIYLNVKHLLLSPMWVQVHPGNKNSCTFHARFFANGELKANELYCIKFETHENCKKFREIVAESQLEKEENKETCAAAGRLEKLSVDDSKTEEIGESQRTKEENKDACAAAETETEEIAESHLKKEEKKDACAAAGMLEKLSVNDSKTEEKASEVEKQPQADSSKTETEAEDEELFVWVS